MPLYPPAGSGSGAPTDAVYITGSTHADLSAERVVTNTATLTWDQGTAGQLKANVVGAPTFVYLGGDVTMPSVSANYADVTGFGFTPAANKDYLIEYFILHTSDLGTIGADFAVNGPASPTSISVKTSIIITAATVIPGSASAYDTGTTSTATPVTIVNMSTLTAILRNGSTSSAFILRHRLETGTTAVHVIKQGSVLRYTLLN